MGDAHPKYTCWKDGIFRDKSGNPYTTAPDFIQSMSVLDIKPGDIIVLKSEHCLKQEYRAHIEKLFRQIGITNKIILLEQGIDIGVMRPL